ncbi:MAG: hypothetical protein BRC30_02320 [Nanohaloarchaea archaeon SW_7_46_7]|nr:MAG: hypothetical protein BRC30_02320 [Nanohaloarchaea archaeon SW_7_46_7]
MDQKYLFLTVLAATLVSSGCIGGGGNGDGGLNIGPGGKTITVTNFEVQPSEIRAGSTTQIRLGIVNTGGMSSNVTIASNKSSENLGRGILINSCPDIFEIKDFDAYSSRNPDPAEEYYLEPGNELEISWSLKNDNEDIPLNGYTCPIRMQIPFDYGVSAYQQLEVKENQETQGATTLESKTSEGPLNIHLETIGSTADQGPPKFIEGDNKEVLVQLENTAPEESSYQGLVDLDSPRIESSENYKINSTSCNMETTASGGLVDSLKIDRTLRLYEGQSRVIRCGVELSNSNLQDGEISQPSIRGQITAHANYTYIKDLGEREIEVKYRG